jgi:hypothetical protein
MGIDAIGIGPDKGIYLDFKRLRDDRGKSIYPVDPATKNTRNEQGRYTMDYIYAPLTNEEATRLADQAEDLTQLFKTLSLEEMTALSTMDQRVFDTVFARGQAVVEESDTPVDNETQDQLSQYQSAHAAPATPNYQQPNGGYGQTQGLTTAGPATTQPSAQKTSQTSPSINFSSKPPEGPVFTQGSVVDNKKVQNFLFPDKKS